MDSLFLFPTMSEIPSSFKKRGMKSETLYPLHSMPSDFFACTGPGKRVTRVAEKLILQKKWNRIVLAGCAGALTDSLKTGDIVVCDSFQADERNPIHSKSELSEELVKKFQESHIDARMGGSYTSLSIVSDKSLKVGLSRKNCLVVEMENYWVAQMARKHNVPFISIRIILDTLEDSLPDLGKSIAPDGRVSLLGSLSHLCRNPIHLWDMLQILRLFPKLLRIMDKCLRITQTSEL